MLYISRAMSIWAGLGTVGNTEKNGPIWATFAVGLFILEPPKTFPPEKLSNFAKLQFLNDKIYKKRQKNICRMAFWQNWFLGEF